MLTLVYTIIGFLSALFNIISLSLWVGYIVVVSITVKYLYTDTHPTKVKPIISAVIGTCIGSFFNYAFGIETSMFGVLGFALAILGTIIYIRIYNRRNING